MSYSPAVVAANIREFRIAKSYTQDYLAAKLNISQNAYSKIELGYSKLTIGRLFKIAEILEIDALEFITHVPDRQDKKSKDKKSKA